MASAAMARQTTSGITDAAKGQAAATAADANVSLRNFTAEKQSAKIGGEAFLLERYFANLSMALAKSPLVIVQAAERDAAHRVPPNCRTSQGFAEQRGEALGAISAGDVDVPVRGAGLGFGGQLLLDGSDSASPGPVPTART